MCRVSEPLRIALVAEGPTDAIVIKGALRSILGARSFVLIQLQPEGSTAFGPLGTGWAGVYRWCKQSAARGDGQIDRDHLLFRNYDMVILHLDADVASHDYAQGAITPEQPERALPCECPCPPASATTDALRRVLLSWCGASTPPPKVVICMPSKSTEAWVLAALFPRDRAVTAGLECFPAPESRLSQQRKSARISKSQRDYRRRESDITNAWPRLAAPGGLGEAARFQRDFLAVKVFP